MEYFTSKLTREDHLRYPQLNLKALSQALKYTLMEAFQAAQIPSFIVRNYNLQTMSEIFLSKFKMYY